MTSRSKDALRNEALLDLGVIAAGQTAPGNDATSVSNKLQDMLEYLEDENLLIFDFTTAGNTENIPSRIYQALLDMLIYRIGPSYGKPQPIELWESGLRRLRRSVLAGTDDTPVAIENY